MESLYACLFSNGHIKVGRSIDPQGRIATHADRVSCMGVELTDRFQAEPVTQCGARESWLIARCAEAASQRFQSEWFEGLDFLTVCEWARAAAALDLTAGPSDPNSFGARLREARIACGLTQTRLGLGLAADGGNVQKGGISSWECGRHDPSVQQIRVLCERLNVSADTLILGKTPCLEA